MQGRRFDAPGVAPATPAPTPLRHPPRSWPGHIPLPVPESAATGTPRRRSPARLLGLANPRRRLLGLDVGSRTLKLVQLAWRGDDAEVEACASTPLPATAVTQRQIADVEAVGEAIARLVADSRPRTRRAAAAIADARIIRRQLLLDAALPAAEIDAALQAEAAALLPDEADDLAVDYLPLGDNGHGQRHWLLAACRRQQVDSLAAALAIGGLQPWAVDIESHALLRACRFLPPSPLLADSLLVDLGAGSLRALPLAGADLALPLEQAIGDGSAAAIAEALRRILQQTTAQGRSLPARLLLAGGGALQAGLAEALADRLQCPVITAQPRLPGMRLDAGQLMALGLASHPAGRRRAG